MGMNHLHINASDSLLESRASVGTLYARLDVSMDAVAIGREVQRLLDRDWLEHVNRADYSGAWRVLPLRCQVAYAEAHPILQGFSIHGSVDSVWANLPALLECPAVLKALALIQAPIQSVRLMQLRAGALIKPHRDHGLQLEQGGARLHIPVFTHPHVHFRVAGREIPMQVGELWYFNADEVHEVQNKSLQDRTHLVIDCVTTSWLEQMVRESSCRA